MEGYGYDFHQTMIAKIEAAQRPLRVRELADFAALYGVDVQDLVYPPARSLPETDQEIAEVAARRDRAEAQAAEARHQLEAARKAMHQAEVAHQASAAEAAVLEGRLASLLAERQKLISWSSGEDAYLAEASGKADALEPKSTPIASTAGGPTVVRILLGAQLRQLREANRITAEEAGKVIRASPSKVRRLEAGRLGFKDRDITDLITLYGVTDEQQRQALRGLARRANASDWWHSYADILPSWFETYIRLEEAAAQVWVCEVQFVPGLLQTEDYARAVTLLGHPSGSTRDIERRVSLRMTRQAVLDRPNPLNLRVVVDEAALRRPIGGPAVMRDQLKYLTEMAERPNVTIQMLPFTASSSATGGAFTLLRFAESDLPDVVYVEQLTGALYLDKPDMVNSYIDLMQHLNTQALTSHETTEVLRQIFYET